MSTEMDCLKIELELSRSIMDGDKTAIDTVVEELNKLEIDQDSDQFDGIKNVFMSLDTEYLENAIYAMDKIEVLKKYDWVKDYILLHNSVPVETLKELVEKDYEFANETDRYKFYRVLSSRVIMMGNKDLIIIALNKMQNL